MFIVTANYLDRRDKANRWYVRDDANPSDEGSACSSILATGIKLACATGREARFGCVVVANCYSVVSPAPENVPVKGVQMRFRSWGLEVLETDMPVYYCDQLLLEADGSIWAVLPKAASAGETELAEAEAVD